MTKARQEDERVRREALADLIEYHNASWGSRIDNVIECRRVLDGGRYVFPYERGEPFLTKGRLLFLLVYGAIALGVVVASFLDGG